MVCASRVGDVDQGEHDRITGVDREARRQRGRPAGQGGPVTTIVRDWVVSLSETPVTVEKLVGPVVSLKKMSPPAVRALDVRKLTVYVVVAPASGEAGVTVAPVTELPNVMEFVASAVPVAGCTVMVRRRSGARVRARWP